MAKRTKPPELTFQQHLAEYLVREHQYGVLEQSDITDTEHGIAEDQLWAFLNASQADTLKTLADDYGTDAREEVFKALRQALEHTPLWLLFRQGLPVRGLRFQLYYPKPRSAESAGAKGYAENRITFRPHFYFGEANQEIDFVIYLNGLPIVALELKHEANQNVHDAVAQFARRDQAHRIFQHPFLYLAADTSDAMAATDPCREENFRWHNMGLTNTPTNPDEYPVEFLYREVLSRDQLLEALSFFLLRVPARDAEDDKPARPAFTLFPRYHQSRLVRRVAEDIAAHFATAGDIGKKYLANHSAGSGKTLSICWLADRLHSLFRPGSNEKLVDITFILTDRKSLDTNIREDIDKFTHIKDVVGIARKADDLPRFLRERRSIIVTTQQKMAWVLEEIQRNPALKTLRVAFLIDEAHRSQDGQMGAAIRLPFRREGEPDQDAPEEDPEERIARVIREHDLNQLFVAFTATPAPATVSMFGQPFDSYTEAEAIAEGYIVDVAASIISYRTLYHLHCPIVPQPDEERLYPKGVVSKALQNVAFQDDGLIQYKAEVMLRLFEKDVKPLIGGRAKAMIVTSSRVAGLRYFHILKEKLRERGAGDKVLYAFSDFVHPETNAAISEHAVNELATGELIEDRFEGDDYRLMVVANKFQTGFDQPLLAGMFLDKPVLDRNAVQTVSRLNRCHPGKQTVVVVDFTNNARQILKAFAKYRQGTPFEPEEPDRETCLKLHAEILAAGVFTQQDAADLLALIGSGTDARVQFQVNALRVRFQAKLSDWEGRKAFVSLLARFAKRFHFLSCFFTYSPAIKEFVAFAEWVGPQLIKTGTVSELMQQIRATLVTKAAVQYQGVMTGGGPVKLQPGKGKGGTGPVPVKASVRDVIEQIRATFDITDEEALYIKEVTAEKIADPAIRATVQTHRDNRLYLDGPYRGQVNGDIQTTYDTRGRYDELADPKYTDTGGIFDIMAVTVIQTHLAEAA
ncbi:DEAD/DEAH box helicase family protein [uncultured Thiocystis sp.]|jgi:type I restriction enzyme R subunit|uniref:DEAD/DEAH box helicase family protein n=1 Tax=uncultured Thiocystis sp. TaxID=1202134 RepID=UPI0025E8C941|nr:DEAD/DEAH box helicase family protein [uncultured Thiocystis sp.]